MKTEFYSADHNNSAKNFSSLLFPRSGKFISLALVVSLLLFLGTSLSLGQTKTTDWKSLESKTDAKSAALWQQLKDKGLIGTPAQASTPKYATLPS